MIILSVEHVKVHSNLLMYYVQEMTNSILVIDYNNIISIKGDRNICQQNIIVGRSKNVWLKKIILGEDLGRARNDTINMGSLMLTIYIHLKTHQKNIFEIVLYLQIQEFVEEHVRTNTR